MVLFWIDLMEMLINNLTSYSIMVSINDLCVDFDLNNISSDRLNRTSFRSVRDDAKREAKIISTPMPDNFLGYVDFYSKSYVLKNKYKSLMFNLEDNIPVIYTVLTFIGLPKPY